MKGWPLIALLVLAQVLCRGLAQENGREKAETAIRRLNLKFEEAHLKGDAAAITAQYTPEAELFYEGQPIIRGHEAIQKAWTALLEGGGKKADIKTIEVQESGDWAYETGTFKVTKADGTVQYDGKYIVIWKCENGRWKMHRDIGNSNKATIAN